MFRNLVAKAWAVLLTCSALPALAQSGEAIEKVDPFVAAIGNHVLEIERNEAGEMAGPGWDVLRERAEEAQFFLIGETHATADIALISAAIHRALAPKGYEHLVVEIGPWSTRFTEQLVRSGETTLADYIATPGKQFTLPFLSWTEEIALINQAIALSPHESHVLWGVDQEFVAGGPVLAPLLTQFAQTDTQVAAAEAFAKGSATNFAYLGAAPQEEIDALIAAFADGPQEARALVDAIALSHRVYGPFVRGSGPIYPANLERENYMKRNFIAHFSEAEARLGYPPKAMFKFGGYHMERGLSGTNVPSFGNFLMEWGNARDFATVHVMIDCLSGEAWAIQRNAPQPCSPYNLPEDSPILAALDGRDSGLIDLTALRPLLRSDTPVDARTRDLILSYDYYLGLRETKAGTPAADLTFPPQ